MQLSREESRRVDEVAARDFGIPTLILMENAGRGAAEEILRRYAPVQRAVVCAGPGNNGGDGFVVARHLRNAGVPLRLFLCGPRARLTPDAATNLAILERMGTAPAEVADPASARAAAAELTARDVVVDALLGTGFRGEVREPMATLIAALLQAPRRALVALDVPSGLDCDLGTPAATTIRADLTVTFVASKTGFPRPGAHDFTGDVIVRDIGISAELLLRPPPNA